MNLKHALVTSSVLALTYGLTAHAQTASAPAAQAAPASTLGEVVVTAQRRSENLQKTAVAISAINGAELQSKGVVGPSDLSKLLPALNLQPLAGGSIQVLVRGVGSFSGNPQTEAGVAINYDGAYLARAQAAGGVFFDLQRVELLKGPQGTLYGRNSTAGALNVITNKPTFDGYHVDALGEAGNYGLVHGSFAANLPVSDKVALRVAATAISRDGYLTDGYDDDHQWAGRIHLLLKPTDDLSILLSTDYAKTTGKGAAGVPYPFLNPSNPYEGPSTGKLNAIFAGVGAAIGATIPPIKTDGYINDNSWSVSSTIEYHPGKVALTIIPAYRVTDVNDHQYGAGFPVTDKDRSKQTSLEARLASDYESPLKWIVGGFYFHESTPYDLFFDQGVARADNNLTKLDTTAYAGFGQLTYAVVPSFRLTGGVRYSHEDKSQDGSVSSNLPAVPPVAYPVVCPTPATVNVATLSCVGPVTGNVTFSSTTWKVGADYDVNPTSLLYFNVGTGFKAGGFFNSLPPNTFQPEKLTAYTLGSKNRFFDNTLQLNVEGFYWKYDNKQVSHLAAVKPAGFNLVTDNAGSATIYGFEVEAVWLATLNDRFTTTIEYDHSRYDTFKFNSANPGGAPAPTTGCKYASNPGGGPGQGFFTIDCSGRPVSFSPEEIVNLSYQHTFELPGGATLAGLVSTRLESSSWLGDDFLPGEFQKASTATDISLTWNAPSKTWSLAGYANNLENTAVGAGSFVQSVIGVPLWILRPPLTYGVRATYHY